MKKKVLYLFFLMVSIFKTRKKNTGINVGLSILLLTGLLILLPPFSQPVTADSASFYPSADTFTVDSSTWENTNYGSDSRILVGEWNDTGICRGYIRFSFNSIPVDSNILNAQLILDRTSGVGAINLDVQSVFQSWSEYTLTYASYWSSVHWATPISTAYMGLLTGSLSVNVTEHVQGMGGWNT